MEYKHIYCDFVQEIFTYNYLKKKPNVGKKYHTLILCYGIWKVEKRMGRNILFGSFWGIGRQEHMFDIQNPCRMLALHHQGDCSISTFASPYKSYLPLLLGRG